MISLIVEGKPGWSGDVGLLVPGAHVAVLTPDPEVGIEGRCAGLELRDTLAVLRAGPTTSFVILFRKPVKESTVADQVTATGTGALNVSGCRVAADLSEFFSKTTGKPRSGAGHAKGYGMEGVFGGDAANPPNEAGRWPSNLVIVHGPECRRIGERRVHGDARGHCPEAVGGRRPGGFGNVGAARGEPKPNARVYGDGDGLETVVAWECELGCPVALLDGQSGETVSKAAHRGQGYSAAGSNEGWKRAAHDSYDSTVRGHNDAGGASRFYPQFESDAELYAWIHRLINPELV